MGDLRLARGVRLAARTLPRLNDTRSGSNFQQDQQSCTLHDRTVECFSQQSYPSRVLELSTLSGFQPV